MRAGSGEITSRTLLRPARRSGSPTSTGSIESCKVASVWSAPASAPAARSIAPRASPGLPPRLGAENVAAGSP